ncbi:hypothetical protein [Armatimonas sp.]|uniref:hypothetical protein n=1 Tax=Armatimonas sp. TaxID=1872638 RepID=UPI00375241D1
MPFWIIAMTMGMLVWILSLSLRLLDVWRWTNELKHWKTIPQPYWKKAKYLLGFS